jgi:outer membrane protein OmpA-like peptidoglycan-associated protein/flagellar hook assembly protein FlgD
MISGPRCDRPRFEKTMYRRLAILLTIFPAILVTTNLAAEEDALSALRGSAWHPPGAGGILPADPQRSDPVNILSLPHLGAETSTALLGGTGAGVVGDGSVGASLGAAVPLRRFVWSGAGGLLADDAGSVSRIATALARPLGSRLSGGVSLHGTFAVEGNDLAAGVGVDLGGRYRLGAVGDLSRVELHAALTGIGSGAGRGDADPVISPFTPHLGLRGRVLDTEAVRLDASAAVRLEGFSDLWLSSNAVIGFPRGIRGGIGLDLPLDGRGADFWPGVSLTFVIPSGRGDQRGSGGDGTDVTLMAQPGTAGTVLLAGSFLTEFPSTDLTPAALTVDLVEPETRAITAGNDAGARSVPGTGLAPVAGREQLVVDVFAEDDRAIGGIDAVLEGPDGTVVREWSFRPLGSPTFSGSVTDRLSSDIALRGFGSTLVWDISEAISEGRHRLRVTAEDASGNVTVAPELGVLVDRRPPEIDLGIDLPAGENGLVLDRGESAAIALGYGDAAVVDVEVIDQAGRSLFHLDATPDTDSGRTLEATWSGQDRSGNAVPDGVYRIRVTARDEFGNQAIEESDPITLRGTEPVFRLSLSDRYLPVDGDRQIRVGTELRVLPGLRDWIVGLYRTGETDPIREWAGIDLPPERLIVDSSLVSSDGEYYLAGSARYANGRVASDRTDPFVVDRQPPRVSIGLSDVVLGRGRRNELIVFIEDDETAHRGRAILTSGESEEPVVLREFDRLPEEFRWSLVLPDGSFLPPGSYSLWIEAEDRAGNRSRSRERRFEYLPRLAEPEIEPRVDAFSPNGDGVADTVSFALRGPETADRGEFVVTIRNGEQSRRFSGSLPVPQSVTWDGRDDFGVPFSDGSVAATLEVVLPDGSRLDAASGTVTIDTTPPALVVERIGSEYVSPDGDGVADYLDLRIEAVGAADVAATILDGEGSRVVGGFDISVVAGEGVRSQVTPRAATGDVLPDGAYLLEVVATDELGNRTVADRLSFIVDTRPVSGFMRVSAGAISPNGDGIADTVTIAPVIPDTEGLVSWSFEVVPASGDGPPLRELAGVGLPVPPEVTWPEDDDEGSTAGDGIVPDGEYVAVFRGTYRHGPVLEFSSPVIAVDATSPVLSVSLDPQPFSPDGDGRDDTLRIDMTADDQSSLSYWLLEIFDPYGEFFYDVGGRGSLPERLRWDGMARNGERVISAERYPWRLEVADELGNVEIAEGEIEVDILVEPFENGYRIQIPSITFPPNSAVLIVDADDPQGRQNRAVLTRLVEILGRFPQYSIVVEGHAVNLSGTAREQEEELLPLSQARAEAVLAALEDRGVASRLLSAVGRGGSVPVAPHTDEQNRWKNRRVDFILQR